MTSSSKVKKLSHFNSLCLEVVYISDIELRFKELIASRNIPSTFCTARRTLSVAQYVSSTSFTWRLTGCSDEDGFGSERSMMVRGDATCLHSFCSLAPPGINREFGFLLTNAFERMYILARASSLYTIANNELNCGKF